MSGLYPGIFLITLVFIVSMIFSMRSLLLANYKKITGILLCLGEFPVNYVSKSFDTQEKKHTAEIINELSRYLKAFEQSPKPGEKVVAIRSNLMRMIQFFEAIDFKLNEGWAIDANARKKVESIRNQIIGIKYIWINSFIFCAIIHIVLFSVFFYMFVSKFYY